MTPVEILIKARDLISVPGRWTKESYAKDAEGIGIWVAHKKAVCWCSVGSIVKVAGLKSINDTSNPDAIKAISLLDAKSGMQSAVKFNDEHSHAEILNLFDRAIVAASTSTQPQT